MRGKRLKKRGEANERRITPADAGKTGHSVAATVQQKDHPRGCGENLGHHVAVGSIGGSPPRMRGKLRKMHEKFGQDRITPADAGKTIHALLIVPQE